MDNGDLFVLEPNINYSNAEWRITTKRGLPYIGGYFEVMPGVHFQLERKPNAWRRFWCSLLLGWTWKEKIF